MLSKKTLLAGLVGVMLALPAFAQAPPVESGPLTGDIHQDHHETGGDRRDSEYEKRGGIRHDKRDLRRDRDERRERHGHHDRREHHRHHEGPEHHGEGR